MLKYSTSGGANARGLASGPASPWDTIGEGLFWCRSAEGRHYHICGTWKDASVYERAVVDPVLRKLLGRFYGAIDLKTAGQSFRREVTAELIRALSSTG